jgi:diguanylate cyclase
VAQTPNVIGVVVMQRLKELDLAATPENYERVFYELSGLPRPEAVQPQTGPDSSFYAELIATLRAMIEDIANKTSHFAQDIGDRNKNLQNSVSSLKSSREKSEILRLLSLVVTQAGGIQDTVEASHRELTETRQTLQAMQQELAETRQLLNEDALTGALNRRGMDQVLIREIARAQRNRTKLTVAMVDLDHFKQINDTFGHETGDQVLIQFAELIRSVMRKSDALVRYGGEEFTLILPETEARGARFVLGRLQQLLGESPYVYGDHTIQTSFSAGIATLKDEENGHALLRRADEAMYAAKAEGRNSIRVA